MKRQYESRTQSMLPRRTFTIIRCDGKAFHTLTRGMETFDPMLIGAMNNAAIDLCMEAQGVLFGYVQSDEISIVMQDFASHKTDAWFDGNVQKIASVAASVVTAGFNRILDLKARFDARVFTIADSG